VRPPARSNTGPAGQYLDAAIDRVAGLEANLRSLVPLAEEAAARLTAGGHLYAVDDGGAFVSELCGRAGGMMMLRHLDDAAKAARGDVVLAGTSNLKPREQEEQLRRLGGNGAMVVLFGSSASPLRDLAAGFVDNSLPLGTAPQIAQAESPSICPASTVGNITAAWTFTGELVGACTRLGRMPTMYQSVFVPGSQVWIPRYAGQDFHDDFTIAPLDAGSIGGVYLSAIRHSLLGIRHTQLSLFRQAGGMCADSLAAGHRVWYFCNGHHLGEQLGLPGDPSFMTPGNRDKLAVGASDVFFWLGYYDLPEPELTIASTAQCRSVWICGARPVHPIPLGPDRVVIDPYWEFGDAVVAVPGYAIRILPPSGVIQTVCLWMLNAEIAHSLRQKRSEAAT
jgi:uncharacterized phosphosugar-binding protein